MKKILYKVIGLIVLFFIFVSIGLFTVNIYISTSLNDYKHLQDTGFKWL
jgi:hypothetical protein